MAFRVLKDLAASSLSLFPYPLSLAPQIFSSRFWLCHSFLQPPCECPAGTRSAFSSRLNKCGQAWCLICLPPAPYRGGKIQVLSNRNLLNVHYAPS